MHTMYPFDIIIICYDLWPDLEPIHSLVEFSDHAGEINSDTPDSFQSRLVAVLGPTDPSMSPIETEKVLTSGRIVCRAFHSPFQ